MLQKFSALLDEIVKDYPDDLTVFLEQKLQISNSKAKDLAERLENNFNLKINNEITKRINECSSVQVGSEKNDEKNFNIYSLDSLSEKEFEQFLKWFFEELGYQVRLTSLAADSGVNLVLSKNKDRIAVQAKRFKRTNKVSNSVILKTCGGQAIYECNKSMIVTTSFFTPQAMNEAKKLNIELWDRNYLSARIDQINKNTIEMKKQFSFPPFSKSLLRSLINLDKTRIFYVKQLKNERYHIFRHGIKYPLISFRSKYGEVKSLAFRINNHQPVSIENSHYLIISDSHYVYGPSESSAYDQIKNYLSELMLSKMKKIKEKTVF